MADPITFAQRVAQNQRLAIDVPTVAIERAGSPNGARERYFINNLGIGFEGAVALRAQKIGWLSGQLCYIMAALQTIFTYQATDIGCRWTDIHAATEPRTAFTREVTYQGATLMVTVGNNHRAGGGFRLTPGAKLDNGLVDAGILQSVTKFHLIRLLILAIKGKHTPDPAVTMLRTPTLDIHCVSPCPVHADGELLDDRATSVSIRSGHRKLLVYSA
jgi:diacylglycerol kinase family enzyme